MTSPRQAFAALRGACLRVVHRRRFESEWLPALPPPFVPAARFMARRDWTPEERRLGWEIERFRSRVVDLGGAGTLESLGSPPPGSFSLDHRGLARGAPPASASVARHSRTGVRPLGGILLRRLVDGTGARRVLELGTNMGFSACYFVSAASRPHLVTVEGSAALCEIARANITRFSRDFSLMHALFDEAIDELSAAGEMFDCVYVDGQHERQATLHYAARVGPLLRPGGIVIFDDIYWSADMNAAWRAIRESPAYGLTLDLGIKGVAVADIAGPTRHMDLCALIGRPPIGRPHA
jgi:predicted O-methyltransferase YrrM